MIYGPYPGIIRQVHDGDTIHVDLDLGFGISFNGASWDGKPLLSCRVYGINAPELSTDAGKAARDFAQTLLTEGLRVSVLSHGWDKYGGRFDGSITLPDGRDFGTVMINSGHAVGLLEN